MESEKSMAEIKHLLKVSGSKKKNVAVKNFSATAKKEERSL